MARNYGPCLTITKLQRYPSLTNVNKIWINSTILIIIMDISFQTKSFLKCHETHSFESLEHCIWVYLSLITFFITYPKKKLLAPQICGWFNIQQNFNHTSKTLRIKGKQAKWVKGKEEKRANKEIFKCQLKVKSLTVNLSKINSTHKQIVEYTIPYPQ